MAMKSKLTPNQKQEIRKQIYERQNGFCNDCGKQLTLKQTHCHEKIFRSQGGKMSLDNSVGLCYSCHVGENARHKGPQFSVSGSKKAVDKTANP